MTEESGSGNRWEPVGAPAPEVPPVAQSTDKAAPRRGRRQKGVLTGMAAALLFGGGAVGFTAARLAGASADDQPGPQQQDVRPVPGSGQLPPPPAADDGGTATSQDES